ncbi:MAG: hypothetical protein HY922_15525 [Elusimicrobia bacterium]|nr:hypothetical protein [Elusimicrobiota bacterium]
MNRAIQINKIRHSSAMKTALAWLGHQKPLILTKIGPLLVLALLELVSFWPNSSSMGLYADDWHIIQPCVRSPDQSLAGVMEAFRKAGIASTGMSWNLRPMALLYYPFVYWIGGMDFWKYQVVFRILEILTAWFLFWALEMVSGRRFLPFLTACLFVVFPNHGATHHWLNPPPPMVFWSAGFLAYGLWLERRRGVFLACSLILQILGALTYEMVIPLTLAMPIFRCSWEMRHGASAGETRRRVFWDGVLSLACAAVLAGYHVLIQRWMATISRGLAWDTSFFFKTLGRGFEVSFNGVVHLCCEFARRAAEHFSWLGWLAAAAVGLLVVAYLLSEFPEYAPRMGGSESALWPGGALLLLVACNIPYALSADRYVPHVFDVQNRLNVASAFAASMLWAWFLLPRASAHGILRKARPIQLVFIGFFFAAFTVANWHNSWEWKEAWSVEKKVLEGVGRHSSEIPAGPALLVLTGAPTQVGNAPAFDQHWVFNPALRIALRRWDIEGAVAEAGDVPVPAGLRRVTYRYPEDRLVVEKRTASAPDP